MTDNITPQPLRVLFLGTHNSSRTQMAEAILRNLTDGEVEVMSAGTTPTAVDPLTIQVLSDMRIDSGQQYAKHVDTYRGQTFRYVIALCDPASETCPIFPGNQYQIQWTFSDPTMVNGSEEARYQAFRQTATWLMMRMRVFVPVLLRG